MINTPKITVRVQGIVSETSIEDDCSARLEEHELSFYLNRNKTPTLSLMIGKKQTYIIDAEIAKKILELIAISDNLECIMCAGTGHVYTELLGKPIKINCFECLGFGYKTTVK